MTGEALLGPLTGKRLPWIPTEVATWAAWKKKHPETTVLRPPFALERYAAVNREYDEYRKGRRPLFPTGPGKRDDRYEPMALVTIVVRDGQARCYPHPVLPEGKTEDGEVTLEREGPTVTARDQEGKPLPTMQAYWFAWCAFHERGIVWHPQ